MKTITVIYISPLESARQHCAELVLAHGDIEVVAIPDHLTQRGVWQALSIADVVIVDEAAIRREGFEAVSMLLAGHPDINCLIVMEDVHDATMVWALTRGVRGILTADQVDDLLAKAIRRVNAGEVWISRRIAGQLREALLPTAPVRSAMPSGGRPARGWSKWH